MVRAKRQARASSREALTECCVALLYKTTGLKRNSLRLVQLHAPKTSSRKTEKCSSSRARSR